MPPTSRAQATLLLLLFALFFIFGFPLVVGALCVVGIGYAALQLAALFQRGWFSFLANFAGAAILPAGAYLARHVLAVAFPDVHPLDNPDTLELLALLYAFDLGLCLAAGMAGLLAVLSVRAALIERTHHSNLPLRAVSIAALCGVLVVAAHRLTVYTIVNDLEVAEAVSLIRGSDKPASLEDARMSADSTLELGVKLASLHQGTVCAGVGEKDRYGVLPGRRLMVVPAATFHPRPWSWVTYQPLSAVRFIECK